MESRNRAVWILIVAVVVVGLCCLALAVAAAAGWFVFLPIRGQGGAQVVGSSLDQSFQVGESPLLKIDNFAGSVTVRAGEGRQIRVVAVRHAPLRANLDRIEVNILEQSDGLLIKTAKPVSLTNAWVELEITAPGDTRLDLHTGSGSVEASDLAGGARVDTGSGSVIAAGLGGDVDLHSGSGSINARGLSGPAKVDTGSGQLVIEGAVGDLVAHTGSGSIDVQAASGPVRLDTGSGSIDYQGSPQGDCRFETGSGAIHLRLPADLQASVDLHTGSGSVNVEFDVAGQVSRSDVQGVIGRGGTTAIVAQTGSGNIDLAR